MIHLAITKSHLICAAWEADKDKKTLDFVHYHSFKVSLLDNDFKEADLVSEIDSTLKIIRNNIAFEGQSVFVSIADELCSSSTIKLDFKMSIIDGWDFAKWTINQRWPKHGDFEFFGRYFNTSESKVYAIRVNKGFVDGLKIIIQEFGCNIEWMGTESSAFFGLNPNNGISIFYPLKNEYKYFFYSNESFDSGRVKYYNKSWEIMSQNNVITSRELFNQKIFILGNLSKKMIEQFDNKLVTQISALSGFIIKGNVFSRKLKGIDLNRLFVLTPIASGSPNGIAINFIDTPGIQPFNLASDFN